MTPRLRLYLLVAGTLAPLIVFGVVAARQLVQHEREAVEREALGRARSAMSAVDAHLRGSIVSLETLAASKSLEAGNIAAFHLEAQRVLRTQPGWVNIGLASADKMQLFNAVYALGKPEPLGTEDASYAAALHGARASFGNVAAGTVVQSPTVRVRVPVSYADEVRYVLSAPQNLKHFAELMQAQRLPDDWGIALIDGEARVITRIPAVPAGVEESRQLARRGPARARGLVRGPEPGRPPYLYRLRHLSAQRLGPRCRNTGRNRRGPRAERPDHAGGRHGAGLRPWHGAGVADRGARRALTLTPPHAAHLLQHRAHRAGVLLAEAPGHRGVVDRGRGVEQRRRHAELARVLADDLHVLLPDSRFMVTSS